MKQSLCSSLRFLCLAAAFLFIIHSASAEGADISGNNWMGFIDGDTLLSDLSMPGTHDSGALYEPFPGTAKCQDLTIGEQLDIGVRFLDIRCRHYENTFVIHHGFVYQRLSFDEVLEDIIDFLKSNPTECVIMCIKEEYNAYGTTRSFDQTLNSYVNKNPDMWRFTASIPTLDQARGKILLMRRFSGSRGINATYWPDNTTFSNGFLRVQDYYNISSNDTKWDKVTALLNEADSGFPGTLYLNYTSGYRSIFILPSITTVSNDMNSRVENYFDTRTSGRYGVIVMDFIDEYRSALIYETNSFLIDN